MKCSVQFKLLIFSLWVASIAAQWGECDVTCGRGRQKRVCPPRQRNCRPSTRLCKPEPPVCPASSAGGQGDSIIGDWSAWTACHCQRQERERRRQCFVADERQCQYIDSTWEVEPCVPSHCDEPEDGQPAVERENALAAARQAAAVRLRDADPTQRFGEWTSWSTCTCHTTTRHRSRECHAVNLRLCSQDGGVFEEEPCDHDGCNSRTPVTDWSEWGPCSCTTSTRSRTRECTRPGSPTCDGRFPLSNTHECTPNGCIDVDQPQVSQNQLPAQAQQNVFGSWGDWAECSCQTRQAQRERRCLLGAVSTCRARGPLMEYQQCNPTGCAQQTAQLAHGGNNDTPRNPNGISHQQQHQQDSPIVQGSVNSQASATRRIGPWSEWSTCTCETRSVMRERQCLVDEVNECLAIGRLREQQPCNPIGCHQNGGINHGGNIETPRNPNGISHQQQHDSHIMQGSVNSQASVTRRIAPPLLGEVKARLFTEVTLHCEVDWMHESPYGVVEWFKNGHAVPKIVGNAKPSSLYFHSLTQSDDGIYVCGVTFRDQTDLHCVFLLHILFPQNFTMMSINDPSKSLQLFYPLLLPIMLSGIFGSTLLLQCRRRFKKLNDVRSGKKSLKKEKKQKMDTAEIYDEADTTLNDETYTADGPVSQPPEPSGPPPPGPPSSDGPPAPGPPSSGPPAPGPPSSGPPAPGPPSSGPPAPGPPSSGPPAPGPPSSGPPAPGPPSSGPPAPGPPSSGPPAPGPPSSGPPAPGPPSSGPPAPGPPSSGPPAPGPPSSGPPAPGPPSSGPPAPGPPSSGPPAPGPPSSGPPAPGPPSSGPPAPGPPSSGPPAPGPPSSGPPAPGPPSSGPPAPGPPSSGPPAPGPPSSGPPAPGPPSSGPPAPGPASSEPPPPGPASSGPPPPGPPPPPKK
ncbi:uncharacterized protein [Apostichopus japonicus]|uniref:uncharacterized protein isoform X2 n=1 Tax=Stichopus japonicus TaxID=307972 RepID=UPI003AB8F362